MTHLTGLFIGFAGKVDELFRVKFGFGFVCALGKVVVPPPVPWLLPPFFAISVSELELLFSNPESDSDWLSKMTHD